MNGINVMRKRFFHEIASENSVSYHTHNGRHQISVEDPENRKKMKLSQIEPKMQEKMEHKTNPLVDYDVVDMKRRSMFHSPTEEWKEFFRSASKRKGFKDVRNGSKLYTERDAEEIVLDVLKKYDDRKTMLYDEILRCKLSEQLNIFQQFHEEYCSKIVKPT